MAAAWQETAWRKKYKAMKPDVLASAIDDLTATKTELEGRLHITVNADKFVAVSRELDIAQRAQATKEKQLERGR